MKTQEMSDKLNKLESGKRIRFTAGYQAGKTFTVLWVRNSPGKKLNCTTVSLLEEGKPETYTCQGVGLATGKVFECSNVETHHWYAQKPYMNWEFCSDRDIPAGGQPGKEQEMDYTKMSRQDQNKILRQNGYRWVKITQDWLDDNDDFETRPGWYLYSSDNREVSVSRAFDEIERGVDVVAEEIRKAREAERAAAQLRRDLSEWKSCLAENIRRSGARPEGEHRPEGERVLDTANIYGGGDWFVIGTDQIWYVRNNGTDGGDWSRNNVRTGGAGAIGWCIPFDAQIAEFLRTLERGELPGGMPWEAYWN